MPSPFSLGVQNADRIFDGFVDGSVAVGVIASGTGAGTVTTATLGFTPDWVLFSVENAEGAATHWATTSTTLTLTGRSTTTAGTIAYIAGNLS